MKIWVFSDLHLEGCDWEPNIVPDCDLIIAAGDIHDPGREALPWLARISGGKPVIYVPGNHEWYAHKERFTIEEEIVRMRQAADETSVHLLMDESVIIDGVRILGSTLWTDFAIDGDERRAMAMAALGMNDHRVIYPKVVGMPLHPGESRDWHRQSRIWLEDELAKDGDWNSTIVVTHHLPHPNSIDDKYKSSALTPAFVSDLSDLVESCGAELWVHGHTHTSQDYLAGKTRVLCNPKGYGPSGNYATYENKAFDPVMVVTI